MARIDLIVGVKNAMKAGLAKAKESLAKLGTAAVNATKQIAKGFLAASAAVIAFGTKTIQAYAKQEGAERKLQAAIEASGESYKNAAPELLKLAAAIQDETGAADEATVANMALLKTLGVATSQLPQAAKGMIALESAGLKGETAARALANAMQGNYSALSRYIPALKNAKTEAEKQAVVNEFLARGYKIQADQLNTVGGQWNQLKNRLGDAMEAIGGAIVESRGLTETMKQLGEWVKVTTERFTDWLKGGGIDQINAAIKNIIDTIKTIIELRFEIALAAMSAATVAAAVKVAGYAKTLLQLAQSLKSNTVAATGMEVANRAIAASSGKSVAGILAMKAAGLALAALPWAVVALGVAAIGKAAINAHKATIALKKSMTDLAAQESDMMEKYGTRNASTLRKAREMIKSGDPEKIATVERLFPKIAAAMRDAEKAANGISDAVGQIAVATDDAVDAQTELKKKIEELEKQREAIAAKAIIRKIDYVEGTLPTGPEDTSAITAEDAARKIREIDNQITELKMSNIDKVMNAAKKAEDAAREAAKKREDLLKQEAKLIDDIRDAQIKVLEDEKKAIEDAAQARIDGLRAQQNEAQKLIDIGLRGVLAQKQADMERDKQAERDARKAERLRKNLAVTGRLSQRDQLWLDAFDQLWLAEEAAKGAAANIKQGLGIGARVAEINRDIADLKPAERKLDAIRDELAGTQRMLRQLIPLG
jgi:hypothetical protein